MSLDPSVLIERRMQMTLKPSFFGRSRRIELFATYSSARIMQAAGLSNVAGT